MNPLLINLARERFANTRPLLRVALLLWLLAVVGIGLNVWLYRDYVRGSGQNSQRLAEIEASIQADTQAIATHRARLASLDLAQQNAVVEFLNEKIRERTFSWSRLFDRLSRVLPADVRLASLAPEQPKRETGGRAGRERARDSERENVVLLSLTGVAKTDEALAELQDRLFAHPSFREVNLTREARQDNNFLFFTLTVSYLPAALDDEPITEPAPGQAESEEER